MKSIRFIGDVHGNWKRYKKIINDCDTSIQVGDFGVGFISKITEQVHSNPPYDHMKRGDHRFIRGNHDNPNVCKSIHSGYQMVQWFMIRSSVLVVQSLLTKHTEQKDTTGGLMKNWNTRNY